MHGATDAASRVAWLDENGIDLESVICLEGMINARFLDDRASRAEVITACNTWLADAVDGHTDRLLPVTCLDFHDVDAAIRELTRMRGRGSRAFLIGTIPVAGVPVMHPQFDPIWSAATDLGMIALLHVGYQPASFDPAWANTAGDMMLLRQLGVSQGHQTRGAHAQRHDLRRHVRPPPEPHRDDRGMWALLVRGRRSSTWTHATRARSPRPGSTWASTRSTCRRRSSCAATCASRRCRACTSRRSPCSTGTRSA